MMNFNWKSVWSGWCFDSLAVENCRGLYVTGTGDNLESLRFRIANGDVPETR